MGDGDDFCGPRGFFGGGDHREERIKGKRLDF